MFRSRFIEIQADSRYSGIPAGGGVLSWSFSVALHSLAAAAAAVMPVWLGLPAATSWFCLGIEPAFFYPLVMYLSRNAICDQCRKFFVDDFQVMIVAIEP